MVVFAMSKSEGREYKQELTLLLALGLTKVRNDCLYKTHSEPSTTSYLMGQADTCL